MRIRFEASTHEMQARATESPQCQLGEDNMPGNGVRFSGKWRQPSQQVGHQHTDSPYLGRCCLVRLLKEHFGCGVCSSTKELPVVWGWFIRALYCGAAKVYKFDLDIIVSKKKDVA